MELLSNKVMNMIKRMGDNGLIETQPKLYSDIFEKKSIVDEELT
jgi:hypothetical protein